MEEVDFKEFPIEIDGIGNFGDLYWAGLKDNPYLISLVKRLRKADFPRSFPEMKMNVRSIALVKSEFGKKGMNYTILGEVGAI